MELIKKTNFDFFGRRRVMYLFSAVVIIAGAVVFGMRGSANFGVDFTGGDLLQVEFAQPTPVAQVRQAIAQAATGDVTVQALGTESREYIVKCAAGRSQAVVDAFGVAYTPDGFQVKASSMVAPSMSTGLRKKALFAFLWGMVGILVYLTIRFEFRFAVGATLAIVHDLLFVTAVLAILRKQIDAQIIAALLTIAGYSVNDTVVVFDRIRENVRKVKAPNYVSLFNTSVNETLSRTILTGLCTIVICLLLFFFGGGPLHTFALTLFIGFIIGTYSSVYVASAVMIEWDAVRPHKFKL